MNNSQVVLDAFVRQRATFVHRDGLRRASMLDIATFDATLDALIAERLLSDLGQFVTLTPWGLWVGATGCLRAQGLAQ